MFNTTIILPYDGQCGTGQGCSYKPYVDNWYNENSANIYRRMVSPYFKDDIPPTEIPYVDFMGARTPKPCGGFWSISPEKDQPIRDQYKLYLPKNPNESEEYNNLYGSLITPPGPVKNFENEVKWMNSQAGRNAEILRGFGYPTVSCGKMDPLLYYVRK